jgi:hypothetical protein
MNTAEIIAEAKRALIPGETPPIDSMLLRAIELERAECIRDIAAEDKRAHRTVVRILTAIKQRGKP